jgi:hypothetical protein
VTTISSRFLNSTPRTARLVLAVLVVVMLGLLAVALRPGGGPTGVAGGKGDLAVYADVVARLKGGELYYAALHAELLDNNYGTASVFNWRPPFYLTLVSWFPGAVRAQLALAATALVAAGMAVVLVARDGSPPMAIGMAVLLAAALLSVAVPRAELVMELTAGVLTLLSVSAYGLKLPWLGFAAALLALFCREIAGVYVVICVILALRERRWAEVGAWGVGLAGFAIYYGWHIETVLGLLGPADRSYPDGWLQFGGPAFVLSATSFNGLFALLPLWATALLLPLAVVGMLASPERWMLRVLATVLAYAVLFALFGKPVNFYWGALYTPLLAFGLVWAWPGLRDLWRRATAAA